MQRSFGAYASLLHTEFGWSKAALSGAFSMQQVENGMVGPLQGWLIDRFGPRLSMRIGVLMLGLGFMAFSQIDSLLGFYLAYVCMAIGSSVSGFFPFTVVIVNWFERQRAKALAGIQLGSAIGGLLVILVALSLEGVGWRTTAFVSGILVIVVGMPLVLVVRQRPEDVGLRLDGDAAPPESDQPQAAKNSNAQGGPDFTLREATHTPAFWLISFGHGSALLIVSAVNVHLILHLTENLDYSLALASVVVTAINGAQMVGTLLGGAIGDRYDKRFLAFGCMAAHTLGILLVAYAVNGLMVFAFAILHGAAWGLRGPMMQAIRADYFGRTAYGAILGTSSLITMIGSISGPLIAGVLADRTGNYQLGFTLLAIIAGLGSVFFLLVRRPALPYRGEAIVTPHE